MNASTQPVEPKTEHCAKCDAMTGKWITEQQQIGDVYWWVALTLGAYAALGGLGAPPIIIVILGLATFCAVVGACFGKDQP